jgi:Flp pilus assembly protein TadG
MQHHRRVRKSRSGVAALELALLLPLLCFLFVVAIDYARVFYFTMTVTNCARCGAIYGSQDPTTANDQSGISAACTMDAGNLNANQLAVTSSTDSATNPTYVSVTVTYPFSTITNFPGITSTTNISRTILVTVTPLTPG